MDYEDDGSADYYESPPDNTDDAVSLWLVFGLCCFAALVANLLYHCWDGKQPDELNESLVAAATTENDTDVDKEEDDIVFGRRPNLYLDSTV